MQYTQYITLIKAMLFINVFKGIRVHITILRIFMYNFFLY